MVAASRITVSDRSGALAVAAFMMTVTGLLQTLPSLAVFVFMIPLFGIGAGPAIAALFLYSLLPIVRNTHAGLVGIPRELRETAAAIGLPPPPRLLRIELRSEERRGGKRGVSSGSSAWSQVH